MTLYLPPTAAKWTESYSSPAPDLLCPMQDAAGSSSAVDVVGGRDLTATSCTFGIAADEDGSNHEEGRKSVRVDNAAGGLVCSDANYGNLTSGAVTAYGRFKFPSSSGVNVLFGALTGSDPRWYVTQHYTGNYLSLLTDNGPTSRSSAAGPYNLADNLNVWVDVIVGWDFTNDWQFIYTSMPSTGGTVGGTNFNGILASEMTNDPLHVFGSGAGGNAVVNTECTYFAWWNDYVFTIAEVQELLAGAEASLIPDITGITIETPVLKEDLPSQWQNKPDIEALVDAFDDYTTIMDAELDQACSDLQINTSTMEGMAILFKLLNASWLADDIHEPDIDATDLGALGLNGARRILRGLAAAHRSNGAIEDYIQIWNAATGDLNSGAGLDISVTTSDQAEVTIQIPDAVNASFVALMQLWVFKIAAPVGITVDINFTPLP